MVRGLIKRDLLKKALVTIYILDNTPVNNNNNNQITLNHIHFYFKII